MPTLTRQPAVERLPPRVQAPDAGPQDEQSLLGNATVQERVQNATTPPASPPGTPSTPDSPTDPTDYKAGAKDVFHGTPTLAQGGNVHTAKRERAADKVRVVASPDTPVHTEGKKRPAQSEIWVHDDAGSDVTHRQGTVENPLRWGSLVDMPLFVEGAPKPDDVQQGAIGDCYFLAAVLSVLRSDPARIPAMLSLTGTTLAADFYRWDAKAGFVPVTVSVTTDLAMYQDARGKDVLQGAKFRIGQDPVEADWSGEIKGSTVRTWQGAEYEAAMWAPLLEKAYAAFSERYGQYGGAPSGSYGENKPAAADPKTTSGYQVIDGGWEHLVYSVFYGDAVKIAEVVQMRSGLEKVGAVRPHLGTIRTLLSLRNNGDALGDAVNVTASARPSRSVDRLVQAIDDVEVAHGVGESIGRLLDFGGVTGEGPLPWWAQDEGARDDNAGASLGRAVDGVSDEQFAKRTNVRKLRAALDTLRPLATAYKASASKANQKALSNAAGGVLEIGRYPALWSDPSPEVVRVRDLLLMVKDLGTDKAPGQRSVYAQHAYAVDSLALRDADGAALEIDAANLDAQADSISMARSSVVLQNPHHRNEPDAAADGPDDGSANDGLFSYSLQRFVDTFDMMDVGVVGRD